MITPLNTRFASLHFTAFYDKQEYPFEYLQGDAVERAQQRLDELQFLFQQRVIVFIAMQGGLMDIECGDKAEKQLVLCMQLGVWRADADAVAML